MGWLSSIVGSSASGLIEGVADAADQFIETDEERKEFEKVMEKIKQEPHLLQAKINKQAMRHPSLFVAGPRSFILWVAGTALAWGWIIGPVATWICNIYGIEAELPKINVGEAITLITSMLGLGGMDLFEKHKGLKG